MEGCFSRVIIIQHVLRQLRSDSLSPVETNDRRMQRETHKECVILAQYIISATPTLPSRMYTYMSLVRPDSWIHRDDGAPSPVGNIYGGDRNLCLVVAVADEVVRERPTRHAHLVVVMGAEVVFFASHESLGGVGGAIRAIHLRHLLDALTLRCIFDPVTYRERKGTGVGIEDMGDG